MISDVPLLRFMVLSALIGFIVFCASYAVLVWKKRRTSSAAPSTVRGRLSGWSVTAIILGCLGILTTIVVRESVRAEGMLGGDGLYAIRATPDLRIVQLAEEGTVKEGDVLARFTSSEALAEIQKAELTLDQLRSEMDGLPSRPLPRDPELARKDNMAESKVIQLYSDHSSKRLSRETASRENRPHVFMQRDLRANINKDLKLAKGDLDQATAKLKIAEVQLAREQILSKKLNVSTNDLNDREKEVRSLEVDVIKYNAQLAATEEKYRICKESLEKLENEAAAQDGRLKADEDEARLSLLVAIQNLKEIKSELAADTKEAQKRKEGDLKDQDFKIKQAEVQLAMRQDKIERKAPYSGRVIYRHPSPGAALSNGPLLVLAPVDGMRFQFPLKADQVEALRKAGTITIELAETANSVEQRFPGKFLQATALVRDPGMALVDLDCQAPPETVAALAEGKPIKARFSWRPPLMNLWPFPVSLILFGLGVFGLVVVNVSGWRPGWPSKSEKPDDDGDDVMMTLARTPTAKEGDTEEAFADTIPLRPELPNVPRERPVQPWEHPVGIRLREAIIREDVSPELLDAIELAIEQQKDAVIVPMREALRRAPTVPDHARSFLDKLNSFDSADEYKLIEKRCLAQRLTFLLYTLGMEIPSKASSASLTMARVAGS